MSSNLKEGISSAFGVADDHREVELVRTLLDKTKLGKIPWSKQGTALTATVPGGVQVNFVLSPTMVGAPASWQLFTVRDRPGTELIRISAPAFGTPVYEGEDVTPLLAAVNDLFQAVRGTVGDDLDRAIAAVKRL